MLGLRPPQASENPGRTYWSMQNPACWTLLDRYWSMLDLLDLLVNEDLEKTVLPRPGGSRDKSSADGPKRRPVDRGAHPNAPRLVQKYTWDCAN